MKARLLNELGFRRDRYDGADAPELRVEERRVAVAAPRLRIALGPTDDGARISERERRNGARVRSPGERTGPAERRYVARCVRRIFVDDLGVVIKRPRRVVLARVEGGLEELYRDGRFALGEALLRSRDFE